MEYYIQVNGSSLALPPKNLATVAVIDKLMKSEEAYLAGDIGAAECIKAEYEFMTKLIGAAELVRVLGDIKKVDANELAIACAAALDAYQAPLRQAKLEEAERTINDPKARKVLEQLNKLDKLARLSVKGD